jgi:hypothetical protein
LNRAVSHCRSVLDAGQARQTDLLLTRQKLQVQSCMATPWKTRDAGDDATRALTVAASPAGQRASASANASEGFHQTWVLLPRTKSVRREGKLAYMSMDFDMGAWVLEDDANAPTTRPTSAVGRSDDMLHTRIKALGQGRPIIKPPFFFQKTLKNIEKL